MSHFYGICFTAYELSPWLDQGRARDGGGISLFTTIFSGVTLYAAIIKYANKTICEHNVLFIAGEGVEE